MSQGCHWRRRGQPRNQTYVYDDTPVPGLDGEAGGRGVVFLVRGPVMLGWLWRRLGRLWRPLPSPDGDLGLDGGDGPQDGIPGLLMKGYRLDRNRQVASRL